MINLLPSLLVIGLCIGILLIVRRGVIAQRREDLAIAAHRGNAADVVVAGKLMRVMRARHLLAIGVALLGAFGMFMLQGFFPKSFGIFLLGSPLVAATLAMGIYAFWKLPTNLKADARSADKRISAGLIPRSTGMFGPAWGILVPGLFAGSLLLGLLIAGFFSGPDERGLFRNLPLTSFSGATLDENMVVTEISATTGSTGPFPGWYYGVPIMGLLVIVGILTLWALHTNTRRPSLHSAGLQEFDTAARNHEGYVISTGVSMLLCFQSVLLLFMAAMSLYSGAVSAAYEIGMTVEPGIPVPSAVDTGLAALSATLGIIALLLIFTGVALLVKLFGWVGSTFGSLEQKSNESASA
ncbi:hypothetical protein CQ018_11110 [Arthrobacter sp. MYb227]|uniref:hypothetical protein n=1 Tax=Arthrobacter sp. MYb227 TaxID=1848601 RepID=UPI000D4DF1A7|nr:hypothetical protein [Arthrobacter sp. MYb227]PQZ92998.1 hypothetical protein CQ018_11110 [Arthrobacter sp. MYb227]